MACAASGMDAVRPQSYTSPMGREYFEYTVKIIGDVPPFRWEVYLQGKRIELGRRNTGDGTEIDWLEGIADSREQAYAMALEGARAAERERRYDATVVKEVLFQVDAVVPRPEPLVEECPETVPEILIS